MSDKQPETEANSIYRVLMRQQTRIESLSKLLATCRDSLKANDYGEDAPGMTAFDKDLVKEIDIVLADDEQCR